MRILYCGQSASGKTTLLIRHLAELAKKAVYDRVYLICPTAKMQELWKKVKLKKEYVSEDATPEQFLKFYDECKQEREKNKNFQGLIIIDDCARTPLLESSHSPLNTEIARCRHYGISIAMCVQYYKSVKPFIRNNLSHLVMFYSNSKAENLRLRDEIGDDFYDIYTEHCKEPYKYILVDFEKNAFSGERFIRG